MADVTAAAPAARGAPPVRKVPDPFPLTLVGMIAMLGPQAINFGISVGGGEAYLLPNIGARGTFHMHWLMVVSVVLEAALVYECIKYSMNTGRSFFAATADLGPKGFWPWYWAASSPPWPAGRPGWRARSSRPAVHRHFDADALPRQPRAAPVHLGGRRAGAVLVVFYLSDRTYKFLERFFLFIMFANIFLVLPSPPSPPSRTTTGKCSWACSA